MEEYMRYDYECTECKTVFEIEKRMTAPPPSVCPKCGSGKIQRHFSPADCPPIIYANRPVWTYNDAKKYKQCSQNGSPARKIDPNKHGDLASWNSPGELVNPKNK
jgi:putative FmdB family regulatory protein